MMKTIIIIILAIFVSISSASQIEDPNTLALANRIFTLIKKVNILRNEITGINIEIAEIEQVPEFTGTEYKKQLEEKKRKFKGSVKRDTVKQYRDEMEMLKNKYANSLNKTKKIKALDMKNTSLQENIKTILNDIKNLSVDLQIIDTELKVFTQMLNVNLSKDVALEKELNEKVDKALHEATELESYIEDMMKWGVMDDSDSMEAQKYNRYYNFKCFTDQKINESTDGSDRQKLKSINVRFIASKERFNKLSDELTEVQGRIEFEKIAGKNPEYALEMYSNEFMDITGFSNYGQDNKDWICTVYQWKNDLWKDGDIWKNKITQLMTENELILLLGRPQYVGKGISSKIYYYSYYDKENAIVTVGVVTLILESFNIDTASVSDGITVTGDNYVVYECDSPDFSKIKDLKFSGCDGNPLPLDSKERCFLNWQKPNNWWKLAKSLNEEQVAEILGKPDIIEENSFIYKGGNYTGTVNFEYDYIDEIKRVKSWDEPVWQLFVSSILKDVNNPEKKPENIKTSTASGINKNTI